MRIGRSADAIKVVVHVEASGGFGQAGDAGGEALGGEAFDGQDGGEFYDDGYGDESSYGYDPGPVPDPQATARALQNVIGSAVQQHIGPIQQEMAEERLSRGAAQLVAEVPALGTQEAAEAAVAEAHQIAAELGLPANFAQSSPQLWRMGHERVTARAAEAQRRPTDPGDAIVGEARGGRASLPF